MESLSIKEAALLLGVTAQTIRKRIHCGCLPATLVVGKYGPEWRVYPGTSGAAVVGEAQALLQLRQAAMPALIKAFAEVKETREPTRDHIASMVWLDMPNCG